MGALAFDIFLTLFITKNCMGALAFDVFLTLFITRDCKS